MVPGVKYERIPYYQHPFYPHRVNGLGMWDKDYPAHKDKGVFRIVVVGDSISISGAPPDATFPEAIEHELPCRDFPAPVEVLNAGVSGYDVLQEAAYIQGRALTLEPDLILWQICLNDFHVDVYRIQDCSDGSVIILPKIDNIFQHSLLYRYLTGWISIATGRAASERAFRSNYPGYDVPENWAEARAQYSRTADILRERGILLLMVLVPLKSQVLGPNTDPEPQQSLRSWAAAQKIPVIDLLPIFRKSSLVLYSPGDLTHLNSEGHRLAANAICDWVVKIRRQLQ